MPKTKPQRPARKTRSSRRRSDVRPDRPLEIQTRRLADLKPAPWNPREISDEALERLAASLDRWGCVEPIIVNDRTGHVVGGHQRLKVLRQQNVAATQVVVMDIPAVDEKALNVALNSPMLGGQFTPDLNAILDELDRELPDVTGKLGLDGLRLLQIDSPEEFPLKDEMLETERECPKCGYRWSGGK